MDNGARPSPGLMLLIVVCMTVLLGIGGSAAFALWQQSSQSTVTDRSLNSAPTTTTAP
ncbi:hypothetical protein [Paenarthrobacter aurescens]|uniref:Uncharacterized protein n=1 Tax=Paenarthrobacter aurescens TaxID=43663 RepID=A0A4Y3NJ93_PAEAU|nr:hypothetical protein [Paenarthrobacter aurescens]UKA50936.1 hypothetical protein LFT48_05240 [Arthrobacter sp. FW305-123]MDO6142666.1 hypothetical protein [Paenarthrobacter aurescens]MDO6146513.1 hypothetical protein [Paenarthrobacter aurescens]MDO6157758.1 hypothetical protein [Paenarthrobacter aurescens]MDO6161743.1 hypothetical protein [Paenarthrobacter aurescens]